jgi:membrane protease YdiL (CAAX protease family)
MMLDDKKSKRLYFTETVFLYLLSCAVIYCALFLASRIKLFDLCNNASGLWRLNPYLSPPYLIAIFLGMIITPLVWEKLIRRLDFRKIGFTFPPHILREIAYGTVFFFLFAAYGHALLPKGVGPLILSPYIIISLSIRWLFVAFGEEMLYRGILQRRLSALWGKYFGLILASVVFAFLGHPKAPLAINLALRLPFGIILGYLYLRSQSLLIPTGAHWAFNILFATY